jgi:hypothetical protein
MAFTEFYCRSGGSNMNGGKLNSGAEPATTAVYSATNGGWNSGTGVFTPTSGNPSLTVTVGDFANVFLDGATAPVFIGRVTGTSSTTVTVDVSTRKSGTAPTTAGTGISINVGGAWKGPNSTVGFPFGFITNALTDTSTNRPRVNFKNDQTYSITAAMTHANNGPAKFQGYTTSAGDGGKATIDGGTINASYVLLSMSNAAQNLLEDLIFQNNGATGSATLVAMATGGGARSWVRRCVFAHSRGHGLDMSQGNGTAVECEAYDCNQSNTANLAGFLLNAAGNGLVRCISHDHGTPGNAGDNNRHGIVSGNSSAGVYLVSCISESNGATGFKINGNSSQYKFLNCDFYNNGSDGILDGVGGGLVKNGGYCVNLVGGDTLYAVLVNNGFGAGTQVNTSGQTNITTGTDAVEVIGSVTYANDVTPWVDPANGDFRISLTAAKNTGQGSFTQTAASYAGAVGFPDIGSNQHLDSGGGSSGGLLVNPGMRGGML